MKTKYIPTKIIVIFLSLLAIFTPTISFAQCTCTGNLVSNPSFESGTTSWAATGGTFSAGTGAIACGSKSGDFQISNASNNYVWQELTSSSLVTGAAIVVKVYAGTHNNSFDHEAGIYYWDNNWNLISKSVANVNKVLSASPTGPQLYTINSTMPSGVGHTTVEFRGTGDWLKTDMWCVTATPPASCNATITGFKFNDVSNSANQIAITNNGTYSISSLPASFNLEAAYTGTVGSMKFTISGSTSYSNIEEISPYNSPSTGTAFTYGAGTYTVEAKAYQGSGASGTLCDTKTITFTLTSTSCTELTNAGSVSGDQTICGSYDPSLITSTAAASGGSGGTIEYIWIKNSTASMTGATTISGATGLTYDPGTITATTWYRRCARRCGGTYLMESNWIKKEVTTCNCDPNDQTAANGFCAPAPNCTGTNTYSWSQTIDQTTGNPSIVRLINSSKLTHDITSGFPTAVTSGPIDISISEYISWDGYPNRSNTSDQPNEKWRLKFYKGTTLVHTSPYTDDGIATGVNQDYASGNLGSQFTLSNGFDKITIEHYAVDNPGGSAGSVVPASFCLNYSTPAACTGVLTNLKFNDLNGTNDVTIVNNGTYNIATLPTSFNLEADYTGFIESVEYTVSGSATGSAIENDDPYNYPGGNNPFVHGAGTYTVEIKAYQGANATGNLCDTKTVTFTIAPNTIPPDSQCWQSPTKPEVTAKTKWTISGQSVTIRTTFSKKFADNTYGNTAVGWPGSHSFSNLTGSDKLQLALYDNANVKKMEFKIDYLTSSSAAPSGFKCLGVTGGDGGMLTGSASDVTAATTSLDVNLNQLGYSSYTTNSPATDTNYTSNPAAPNWIYEMWYEVTVNLSAFGTSGFGRPDITSIHASPSKTGNNTEVVVPGPCPTLMVSGNVFYDFNGLADNVVNGTPIGKPANTTMYVNLVSDSSGNVVKTTTVNNNGTYSFSDVTPNSNYKVVLSTIPGIVTNAAPPASLPVGWANVSEDCCDNIGNDGNTNGETPVSIVTSNKTNVNFGIRQPLAIGNLVWIDSSKNGLRESSELPLGGSFVRLYADADSNQVPDGSAIDSMTTGSNGLYVFEGLNSGNYIVGVTPPVVNNGTYESPITGQETNPNLDVDNNDNGITKVGLEVRSGTITLLAQTEPANEIPNNSTALDLNANLTIDFAFYVCPNQFVFDSILICAADMVNLTAKEPTGFTGGTWTKNNVVVANPTAVGIGNYVYTYINGSCTASGTLKIILNVPDYAPTIQIDPNATIGIQPVTVVLTIQELLNRGACSEVYVLVPKLLPRYSFVYDSTKTTIGFLNTPINNPDWQFYGNVNPSYYIWRYTGNSGLYPSGSTSKIGYVGSYDPNNTDGQSTFSVQIFQGSGGETNPSNNTDSEILNYIR